MVLGDLASLSPAIVLTGVGVEAWRAVCGCCDGDDEMGPCWRCFRD